MDTTAASGPRARPPRILPLALVGLLTAGAVTTLLAIALLDAPAQPTALPEGRGAAQHVDPPADGPAPGGASHAFWGRGRDGLPLRWDPCAPVPFVVNLRDAPEHAERDLARALALLSAASGLDLVLVGRTDEEPASARPLVEADGAGWRWRPVLVAWADPARVDVPLGLFDRGLAIPIAVRDGDREALVTGQVVLNARRADLVPGFADRSDAVGATLLHELGHILGLAHVDDPTQLMAVEPGAGPVVLGTGDREGLRAIGSEAGCLDPPRADVGRGLVAAP